MSGQIAAIASGFPVFLLSGQGSQRPGMGADLMDVPEVAEVFSCASDVLGYDVADLVANADPEKLNDTRYAQPALCALSVGIARALEARGAVPVAVLGFSLGQVSALAVSGMLSDEETFAFVKARSEFMAQAAATHPGAMSALLKADEDAVRDVCAESAQGEVLVPANFNCPGQIVIAGTVEAVARAEQAWSARGRRFSRLATSGAFHSPLMADASRELASYLERVEFAEPRVPLICNTDAEPLAAADARSHLVRHLVSPVRFQQSIEALRVAGADTFVEVGFGGVLANLVRRIDKAVHHSCVQDRSGLEGLTGEFSAPRHPAAATSSDSE